MTKQDAIHRARPQVYGCRFRGQMRRARVERLHKDTVAGRWTSYFSPNCLIKVIHLGRHAVHLLTPRWFEDSVVSLLRRLCGPDICLLALYRRLQRKS